MSLSGLDNSSQHQKHGAFILMAVIVTSLLIKQESFLDCSCSYTSSLFIVRWRSNLIMPSTKSTNICLQGYIVNSAFCAYEKIKTSITSPKYAGGGRKHSCLQNYMHQVTFYPEILFFEQPSSADCGRAIH